MNPDRRPLKPAELAAMRNRERETGASMATVGGTIGVGANGQPLDFRPQGFWAVLTDDRDGNRYGWTRVYPQGDGTYDVEGGTGGDTMLGASDSWPAVEVGGSTGVAEGTVVWLEPGQGAYFTFSASAAVGGIMRAVVDRVTCDALGNLVNRYTVAYGPAIPTPPTGSNVIGGTVTVDSVGTADREVVLTYDGFEWRATTDGSGHYSVSGLPGGTYVVLVVPLAGESGTVHQSVTVPTTPATANFSLTT